MTPATRAAVTPLLVVFLLVVTLMWMLDVAPRPVALGAILACFAGLAFMAITKKKEVKTSRHTRNHRRPGHTKA